MMTDAISVALPTGFLAPHTKSYAFSSVHGRRLRYLIIPPSCEFLLRSIIYI